MTIDEPQPTKDSGGFGCISDVILRELFGNNYKQTNHFNSNARLWPQVGCGQRHVATKAWNTKDPAAFIYDEGSSIDGVRRRSS